MRIRTRFNITMALFGVLVSLALVSLIVTNRQVDRLTRQQELARSIEREAGELGYLSQEYLLYHEGRLRTRWETKFTEFSADLSRLDSSTPEQLELVKNIRASRQRMKAVFDDIVKTVEGGTERRQVVDTAFIQVPWSRMTVQTQGIVFDASRLSQMMHLQADRLNRTNLNLILVLIGIFGAYFVSNYVLLHRHALDSINALQDGIKVIGSGKLDFAIPVRHADEIGELSGAFNQMAEDLKNLTASKSELEREVAERKRAEGALAQAHEASELDRRRLEAVLDTTPVAVVLIEASTDRISYINRRAAEIYGTDYGGFDLDTHMAKVRALRLDGTPYPLEELPVSHAFRGERVHNREMTIERPDGVRVPVVVNSAPLTDARGEVTTAIVVFDDISERKRAEEAIRASLHEKEVLLNEIHHRVKNNMQLISSLVSLQAEGIRDENVREVLKDVTYRVRSMALVHEKLYQSDDLARIDFAAYCRSLLGHLWRAHGALASSIRLTFDLEPVQLPVDIAVPCGLILNELAGNTLKHAFWGRSGGEVAVSLKKDGENGVILRVADNGAGLPEGLDWRQANSLGLRLVQMLSSQLDAKVEVSCGEGTVFEVKFSFKK